MIIPVEHIFHVLDTLIQASRQILLELDKPAPSLENIASLMESREQPMKALQAESERGGALEATDADRERLKMLFEEFDRINTLLLPKLNALKEKQSAVVQKARQHTQAQNKYHGIEQQKVLEKPDISYYK